MQRRARPEGRSRRLENPWFSGSRTIESKVAIGAKVGQVHLYFQWFDYQKTMDSLDAPLKVKMQLEQKLAKFFLVTIRREQKTKESLEDWFETGSDDVGRGIP